MMSTITCFLEHILWVINHKRTGREFPLHWYKERVVIYYAKRNKCKVFIETGTFFGEMVMAINRYFERVYSVEIDKKLYLECVEKFSENKNVEIVHGDSGKILGNTIEKIGKQERIIFWLDGHYSGGVTGKGETNTPILQELCAIIKETKTKSIILIDDARIFINGEMGYPSIEELKAVFSNASKKIRIKIKHDIIRILYTP